MFTYNQTHALSFSDMEKHLNKPVVYHSKKDKPCLFLPLFLEKHGESTFVKGFLLPTAEQYTNATHKDLMLDTLYWHDDEFYAYVDDAKMEDTELRICLSDGYLRANVSTDPSYPGIDVEYVADYTTGHELSHPRVLVEQCEEGPVRALIWNDDMQEDYTEEIIIGG